jgi:hypothetical protein
MSQRFRNVIIHWLIQATGVWIVINLFTVIPYIYFVNRNGDYLFHEDKSPITAWEYFVQENYRFDMFVVLIFLLFVELNYNYLFKKLTWAFFVASCLGISILSFIILASNHLETLRIWGVLSTAQPIILMAAYAFVYAIIRDYLFHLTYKKDLRLQKSEVELNALKAQLNPHFLFNSLNYLYGTALKEQASLTADGIDKLSEMLRYTVIGMQETFVPIDKEISFIENYVEIQKARQPVNNKISLDLHLQRVDSKLEIAPMLLLTFIENAFKYGISTDQSCYVRIKIELENSFLTMETRNRIIKTHAEVKVSNTGLKSTIKRLELLYPGKYILKSTQNGDEYKTLLSLKLETEIRS